jgi:queuine tRNA-ribosyltransferase
MDSLQTQHSTLQLPAFFPDATLGFVRCTETKDLFAAGTSGAVVNAYHLFRLKKGKLIEKLGGIHKFMGLEGKTIITDSGGWQVMSLIHDNPKLGVITDEEINFTDPETKEKIVFTPELSIQLQMQLNPDIMICLDNCTRPDAPIEEQEKSVKQTILWAKRCKATLISNSKFQISKEKRPLLFAVIQGGNSKELRKKCAEELLKIGFDGFSFGGHPVGSDGKLVDEILEYTAKLIPDEFPKYAMGVGRPEDIVKCFKWGYTMFDCVIPTREARHKKLYVWENSTRHSERGEESSKEDPSPPKADQDDGFKYDVLYINTALSEDTRPIDSTCDCQACKNYSRAYILHLFQMKDPMGARLATIHNLRFYARLMEKLQKQVKINK